MEKLTCRPASQCTPLSKTPAMTRARRLGHAQRGRVSGSVSLSLVPGYLYRPCRCLGLASATKTTKNTHLPRRCVGIMALQCLPPRRSCCLDQWVRLRRLRGRSCLSDLYRVYHGIVHKSMISVAVAEIGGCFVLLHAQERRAHAANERDVGPIPVAPQPTGAFQTTDADGAGANGRARTKPPCSGTPGSV